MAISSTATPTPRPTATVTVTAPPPTPTSISTPAPTGAALSIYWQGQVGTTPNSLNFDTRPPAARLMAISFTQGTAASVGRVTPILNSQSGLIPARRTRRSARLRHCASSPYLLQLTLACRYALKPIRTVRAPTHRTTRRQRRRGVSSSHDLGDVIPSTKGQRTTMCTRRSGRRTGTCTSTCRWLQFNESACRPGSVTPLSVTWQYSPKCWLTCRFTSHGFSSVRVSFHALPEQRRNWQISGRRSARSPGRRKRTSPGWSGRVMYQVDASGLFSSH